MGSLVHPRLFRSLCGGALGAALALVGPGGVPGAAASDLPTPDDLAHAAVERGLSAQPPAPLALPLGQALPRFRPDQLLPRLGPSRPVERPQLTTENRAPAAPERGSAGGAQSGWSRPVARSPISAPYGLKGDWAAGHHTGVDFAVPVGTPVYSVGSGTVVFAGRAGAYGKVVKVRSHDGHYILYAHLSRIRVGYGAGVSAGTVIGASGDSGRTTGPHLHLEVRTRAHYGSDIDPVAYLAARGVRLP